MIKKLFSLLILFSTILVSSCSDNDKNMTPDQIENMVADAYVQTFSIVENYKGMYFYGILESSPKFSKMNVFENKPRLYTPEDIHVITPNNDTFYDVGSLDLRAEPVIFKVPDSNNRYYVYQLVSMTTDNFSYIGTRLTGNKAGVYALTGPNFDGKLPDGVTQIKSPSEFVVVVGRIAVDANDVTDIAAAKDFYGKVNIGVMSKFYPEFKPKTVEKITNWPVYNENTLTTPEFFATLNFLLPYIKLSEHEQKIIDKYKAIGIEAGKPYTFINDNTQYKDSVVAGINKGIAKVNELAKSVGEFRNGWQMLPIEDLFGENYELRTAVAKVGIYANCAVEAYYSFVRMDNNGQQLNGKNTYTLTFPAGQLPPAKFFWSISMYDAEKQLLVKNPLGRYSIGDRTKNMKYNEDGSLTLYFSNKEPKEGVNNWLPAPDSDFYMVLRIYGPKENVLQKKWLPEPVIKK